MSNIMLVLTYGVVKYVLFFAVSNNAIQFINKILVMPSMDSPGQCNTFEAQRFDDWQQLLARFG